MRVDSLADVVGVDEGDEVVWEGHGVADEGGELPVMRLAHQDGEVVTQLGAPVNTAGREILG